MMSPSSLLALATTLAAAAAGPAVAAAAATEGRVPLVTPSTVMERQGAVAMADDARRRQEGSNYCVRGPVVLSTPTGRITDHDGPGNYRDRSVCRWIVDVPDVESLAFTFTKLDLEARYDFVAFFEGRSLANEAQVAWYTGNMLPQRPLLVNSSVVTVLFYSDQLYSGLGFSVDYSAQNCQPACEHGVCSAGSCLCDSGWRGEACDLPTCSTDDTGNACGTHGTCNRATETCICEPGYYGGACIDRYCDSGTTPFTASTGSFVDHFGGGEYLNAERCVWDIQPSEYAPGDTIMLTFPRLDLEEGYDQIHVFEVSPQGSQLIASVTGTAQPAPIAGTTGALRVEFVTDQGTARTGFEAQYRLLKCPGGCGSRGLCWMNPGGGGAAGSSACHCDHGYTGPNCAQTECLHDCWSSAGAGTCVGNACQCAPGFDGADCGICTTPAACAAVAVTQCDASGSSLLSSASGAGAATRGNFSDHSGLGDYLPDARCSWSLDVSAGQVSLPRPANEFSIDINFDYLDMERGARLMLASTTPTGESRAFATFFGPVDRPPALPASAPADMTMQANWLTTASTDVARGFRAQWSLSQCAAGCGAPLPANGGQPTGECVRGHCECHRGWHGADCSVPTCDSPSVDGAATGAPCGGVGVCDAPVRLDGGTAEDGGQYLQLELAQSLSSFSETAFMSAFASAMSISPSMVPRLANTAAKDADNSMLVELWVVSGTGTGMRRPSAVVSQTLEGVTNMQSPYYAALHNPGTLNVLAGWRGGSCDCPVDTFGALCDSGYCAGGPVVLDQRMGAFSDHDPAQATYYQPNSDCSFLLLPRHAPGSSGSNAGSNNHTQVSLFIEEMGLQWTYDRLTVYDGTSSSARRLYSVSGSFVPHPVRSTQGALFVEFTTNEAVEFSGFRAQYSAVDECPSSCNGRGDCFKNKCFCDAGWWGTACGSRVVPDYLSSGKEQTVGITQFSWRYFRYDVRPGTTQFVVEHRMTSNHGHADFYLKQGDLPTHDSFDQAKAYYSPTQSMRVVDPATGPWYVGVYARHAASVSLTLNVTEPGSSSTSGTAAPGVGESAGGSSNDAPQWVYGLLIFISIAFLALLGLVAFYLHRRGCAQLQRTLRAQGQADWDELNDELDDDDGDDDLEGGVDLSDSSDDPPLGGPSDDA